MRVRMGSSVSCLLNDDHLLLLEMKGRDKVMVKEKDGDGTQALFHTWYRHAVVISQRLPISSCSVTVEINPTISERL